MVYHDSREAGVCNRGPHEHMRYDKDTSNCECTKVCQVPHLIVIVYLLCFAGIHAPSGESQSPLSPTPKNAEKLRKL